MKKYFKSLIFNFFYESLGWEIDFFALFGFFKNIKSVFRVKTRTKKHDFWRIKK